MKVSVDKSFEKDTNRIKDKALLKKIADCIEAVQKASTLKEIPNFKKLKGGSIYYRIGIGDYRIGLMVKNSEITFTRCLHRKDIYSYFP
jgi:mRNA interferase RelE/StbE